MNNLIKYIFPDNVLIPDLQKIVIQHWMPAYAIPYLDKFAQNPKFKSKSGINYPYLVENGKFGVLYMDNTEELNMFNEHMVCAHQLGFFDMYDLELVEDDKYRENHIKHANEPDWFTTSKLYYAHMNQHIYYYKIVNNVSCNELFMMISYMQVRDSTYKNENDNYNSYYMDIGYIEEKYINTFDEQYIGEPKNDYEPVRNINKYILDLAKKVKDANLYNRVDARKYTNELIESCNEIDKPEYTNYKDHMSDLFYK